ncbi:MAG: sigma 54-interacting transcriptional regulator [Sporomusaceae bacterium]|nr:sigma 54-interacting transcriptional regulator [Sporomusaceae bacterium]
MNFDGKRIVLMSYPRLTKVISQLVPSYLKEVIVYEAQIHEVLDISRKLIYENAVDVIISGGGNGQCLKENIKEIPVIVFKITVANLLEGIKSLSKQSSKIGILGYKNAIPDLLTYREYIACDFVQEWYDNQEQMPEIFGRMVDSGCDGFIGTGVVCDYATDFGFSAYMVYSRDNVENTFREAFEYEGTISFNKEREERTNVILNHSKRAFLFINPDRIIQTANSSAEKILGIPGNKLVGSNLDEIVSLSEYDSIINGTETESMIKMMGKELVVTWKPIRIENQLKEVIAFFDDSYNDLDLGLYKSRKELLQSGFFASYSFRNIVGHSKPLQDAIDLARDYARNNLTVLIRGETGTGKELFAQSIHTHSSRSNRPFVSVNCSALPESLLESELFGYESGTFTGGRKEGKPGLIERADTGTLFLDEIGDMSLEGQVMLLRVLQEKKVRRLGGNKIIPVDVRIIAATNQPLESLIHKELFRSDLYYRLNVLSLEIPPLRGRRGDIPDLVEHFVNEHKIADCSGEFLETLKTAFQQVDYYWPGNIRELENVFLRITASKCRTPQEINLLLTRLLNTFALYPEGTRLNDERISDRSLTAREEKAQILQTLERMHWNKTKAAKFLGMSRTTFWRKLSDLGIN